MVVWVRSSIADSSTDSPTLDAPLVLVELETSSSVTDLTYSIASKAIIKITCNN